MLEILKKLSKINTASGAEKELLEFIKEGYGKYCDESFTDNFGNLILHKKSKNKKAKKIMLCANCDCCGFIVNYIEENGYLRVTKLGNPNIYSSSYREITIKSKKSEIKGFILPEKEAEKAGLAQDFSKLYVDIGAKSKKDAEKSVELGDICSFSSTVFEMPKKTCGGAYISSKIPVAVLLDILKSEKRPACDLYVALSVQGALGDRGAKPAAFDILPDLCVCLEVCQSLDYIGANIHGEATIGDGAAIIVKGADFCLDTEKRDEIIDICKSGDIKNKLCVYREMKTLAGTISKTKTGIPCVEVGVPVRNAETGAEIFSLSDVENTRKLVLSLLEQ